MRRIFRLPRKGISRAGLFGRIAIANLLALVPLAAFALIQMTANREGQMVTRDHAALGLTLEAARPVTSKLMAASTTAANIAAQIPSLLEVPETCVRVFETLNAANPTFNVIGYRPLADERECGRLDFTTELERLRLPYAGPDESKPSIFLSEMVMTDKRMLVVGAAHPVQLGDDRIVGHVIVTIPHDDLKIAASPGDTSGLSSLPIGLLTFNAEGRIITTANPLPETAPRLPADIRLQDLAIGHAHSFSAQSMRDIERIYAVTPIADNLYLLGIWARNDEKLYLSEVTSGYLLAGLMIVSGLAAALFASEWLVIRHIRKLAAAMTNFARGDRLRTDPALDNPPREIAELADAYGNMTTTILIDEAEMQNYLHEREKMLRELHHRTGNSLQLIASILRMHLREDPDPQVRLILENLHDRVMGLSTVHLGLYRVSDYDVVQIDEILRDVITKIDGLRGTEQSGSRVTAELAPLIVPIATAVPLALLLAEVVFAFLSVAKSTGTEAPRPPALRVTLNGRPDGSHLEMTVIGPAEARPRLSATGGGAPGAIAARLIRGFLRQIDGEVEMSESDGLLTMRFTILLRQSSGA